MNKDSGETNAIEDDGINFKLIYHVIPEEEVANVMTLVEADFPRQG